MKVKKVYQDNKGNWHINYGFTHLMGLAIRVQLGGLFLGLTIVAILILGNLVLSFVGLSSIYLKNFIDEAGNSSSDDVRQESVEQRLTQ